MFLIIFSQLILLEINNLLHTIKEPAPHLLRGDNSASWEVGMIGAPALTINEIKEHTLSFSMYSYVRFWYSGKHSESCNALSFDFIKTNEEIFYTNQ